MRSTVATSASFHAAAAVAREARPLGGGGVGAVGGGIGAVRAATAKPSVARPALELRTTLPGPSLGCQIQRGPKERKVGTISFTARRPATLPSTILDGPVCHARSEATEWSLDSSWSGRLVSRQGGGGGGAAPGFLTFSPTRRGLLGGLGEDGDGVGKEGHKRVDERTLRLGKTIRILHDRMPSLLTSPLPHEILSPQITLNLFPSTHPHLPTVTGRLAYVAALWTAPVAWGSVPVLGNVKLEILSERMFRVGRGTGNGRGGEKLIVKWRTCGKAFRTFVREGRGRDLKTVGRSGERGDTATEATNTESGTAPSTLPSRSSNDSVSGSALSSTRRRVLEPISSSSAPPADDSFTGLFIFEFDELGRVLTHTIEHAEESGDGWEHTSRFVTVTDWLLGKALGKAAGGVGGGGGRAGSGGGGGGSRGGGAGKRRGRDEEPELEPDPGPVGGLALGFGALSGGSGLGSGAVAAVCSGLD